MSQDRVIVRDYRGYALHRFVHHTTKKAVFVTNGSFPLPTGFYSEDVFCYDGSVPDGQPFGNWEDMKPYSAR